MEYQMEELIPIVSELAKKYTACQSTSVTYEKAEQLMGAVLYCIHEAELTERNAVVPGKIMPAQQVYKIGAGYVEQKAKKALELYNRILPEFNCYGNYCLHDTVVKGIPEFFKWYDMQFEPQNTILTLDYPLLRDISKYTGVDKIYEFLTCIALEQKFLQVFPENDVKQILSKFCRDDIINICEMVLTDMTEHILSEKSLSESDLEPSDYLRMRGKLMQTELGDIRKQLQEGIEIFVERYCENCGGLSEYLGYALDGITIRLKNRAEYDSFLGNFTEISDEK